MLAVVWTHDPGTMTAELVFLAAFGVVALVRIATA
jgi:hypothetical protein